jgi:hypothetical protein
VRRISKVAFGLAAATASACLPATAPIDPDAIRLPEERLTLVAGNSIGAIFIAPDSLKWTGRTADVLVYKFLVPGSPIGNGKVVVEEVDLKRFDCDAQTYQDLASAGFDSAGANIVSHHDFAAGRCDLRSGPASAKQHGKRPSYR